MYKFKCNKCGKTPDKGWYYMPETSDRLDYFFCDDCVPRGCSCNSELKEGIDWNSKEAEDPKNYFELTDDKGRKLPCCEYSWDDNEFEQEQRLPFDEEDAPWTQPFDDGI